MSSSAWCPNQGLDEEEAHAPQPSALCSQPADPPRLLNVLDASTPHPTLPDSSIALGSRSLEFLVEVEESSGLFLGVEGGSSTGLGTLSEGNTLPLRFARDGASTFEGEDRDCFASSGLGRASSDGKDVWKDVGDHAEEFGEGVWDREGDGEGGGDMHGDVMKGGDCEECEENECNENGEAEEHCEASGDDKGLDPAVQPSSACASRSDFSAGALSFGFRAPASDPSRSCFNLPPGPDMNFFFKRLQPLSLGTWVVGRPDSAT